MITETDLLSVVDVYSAAKGWKDATSSRHIFNDGKKIAQLRSGGTITLTRLNDALRYLARNWPDDAVWPENIEQPKIEKDLSTS